MNYSRYLKHYENINNKKLKMLQEIHSKPKLIQEMMEEIFNSTSDLGVEYFMGNHMEERALDFIETVYPIIRKYAIQDHFNNKLETISKEE